MNLKVPDADVFVGCIQRSARGDDTIFTKHPHYHQRHGAVSFILKNDSLFCY